MLDTGQLPLKGEAFHWFREGLKSAAEQEYERAIFYYDRVLRVRPDFYEAWHERGLALEHWGDYAEAIASFDAALKLQPKPDVVCQLWLDRGNALQYGLGDYVAAIACYDRVLRINANHELTWQNRGNALLYGLGVPEEALSCYDRCLQINPDSAITWRNRGNALMELQRLPEAVASYDRALVLNPDDEVCWSARDLALAQSGLRDREPTTNPAWANDSFGGPTLLEDDNSQDQNGQNENSQDKNDLSTLFGFPLPAKDTFTPLSQPFLVIEDDWGRREIILDANQYVLGRDPNCDICLHSQFASRHHAVLVKVNEDDGTYTYQIRDGDLSGKLSTNGLLINGHKQRSWELKSGDVVVFGPRLRVIYRLSAS